MNCFSIVSQTFRGSKKWKKNSINSTNYVYFRCLIAKCCEVIAEVNERGPSLQDVWECFEGSPQPY